MDIEKYFDNDVKMCFAKGQQLLSEGKTLEAKIEFNSAIDKQIAKYGEGHESLPICYVQAGMCHVVANEHEKAVELFDKALAINLKHCDYNSQEVANCYFLLGNSNMALKNYEEASLDFGHVVIISCHMFGEKSEEANQARGMYNKAMLLYKPVEPTEADKALEAMTDDEECYKKGSEYFDNGVAYLSVKYFDKAIELRRAKGIPDDNKIIAYYRALTIAYTEAELPEKALEYLDELLAISIKLYGEKSQEVSSTYNFRGYNFLLQNDYPNAIDALTKMLNINIELYGEKDPEVIRDYSVIANVHRMNNDLDKALDNMLIAEKLLKSVGTDRVNHDLSNCYANIASLYFGKQDYPNVIKYLQDQVRIEIGLHGENNMAVLDAYKGMARSYQELGKYDEVKALIEKINKIDRELKKNPHADECTCGCHDHEHEHHHDDDCDCGCHDHEHEHHHDDDCDCGCHDHH